MRMTGESSSYTCTALAQHALRMVAEGGMCCSSLQAVCTLTPCSIHGTATVSSCTSPMLTVDRLYAGITWLKLPPLLTLDNQSCMHCPAQLPVSDLLTVAWPPRSFTELGKLVDPGQTGRGDKLSILCGATKEIQRLRTDNDALRKINTMHEVGFQVANIACLWR